MSEFIDIETLKNILRESCFGASPSVQEANMKQLESIKGQNGVVPLLYRIVNVNDAGATVPTEVRQFASLAAKCAIQRHWTEKTEESQLSEEDKNSVKSFLLSYRNEPECHIANQLSSTIAKIMKSDWPTTWNEIIPSLIRGVEEDNIITNIRSMVSLDEILTELQSKAAVCPDFKKIYNNLCVQLYPSISKAWALSFKALQSHLASMNVNAAEYVVGGAPSPYGVEDRNQSVQVYYLTRICNVIRMIIENSYVSISALPTFKTFWKTYVGALQMISGFLRKARPLANVLLQQAVINGSAVARRGPGINTKWDENSDDTCDYYIPVHLFNEHNSGLFSYLNMLLKLNKSLACTPVHLQRMYSMEVVPYLEPLLVFFYNHLAVEYDLASSSSSAAAASGAKKGPQLLPLCYLTTTAIYFLHNVLSCSAYDSVNVHKPQKKRQNDEGQMDEVEVVGEAANAYEIRARFFSSEKVTALVQMLVHYTLRYKPEDFREWAENSELFYLAQVCPGEKCTMRSASECLYHSLLEFDTPSVSKVIFSYLNNTERQMALTSLPDTAVQRCGFHQSCEVTLIPPDDILLYESVYLCASLSVSQFSALGDCTLWLRGVCGPVFGTTAKFYLAPENCQQVPTAGARLLLSRLSALLAAYGDHFITMCVYCVCDLDLSIINCPTFDEMIKLNAVSSLAQAIQSYGFSRDTELNKFQRENEKAARGNVVPPPEPMNFAANAPFAHRMINVLVLTVQSCCTLISQLEECESKLVVLALVKECIQVLSTVHNEMKFEVMYPIADYLSKLWAMTSDRDPTRCVLLEVFRDLIKSANSHSVAFHPLVLPLISYSCTSASRSCNGSLLRDGMALWLAVMRNTVGYSVALDDLFFSVMTCLFNNGSSPERSVPISLNVEASAFDAELIKDLMLLVEAYVLVGKGQFITPNKNQQVLFAIFSSFVGKVSANLVQYITRPLELLLVVNSEKAATEGGVVRSDVASSFLQGSGMLAHLCRIILASCQCTTITGVFQPFVTSDVANLHYITLVMRVLLVNPLAVQHALVSVKQEIFSYLCKLHNVCTAECNLTEGVLLNQIVLCALHRKDQLESVTGSLLKQKIWCLGIASLYPSQVTQTLYTLESLEQSVSTGSSASSGCIFETIKNYMLPPPPPAVAPVPVVKTVTTTVEDASYAWKGVVTVEQQLRWVQGLVKLAETIVSKVGMVDACISPRVGGGSFSTVGTATTIESGASTGSGGIDAAVDRAVARRESLYSSTLRELIAASGEDVMSAEDMDELEGFDEEPIVELFLQTMYSKDLALNGNVADVVMAKLNNLRATIGEEQYRQLNIRC